MPVQFRGITIEHRAVRESVGVFDISHMGQLVVRGRRAGGWLNRQLTNQLERLGDGQGQYTLLLGEQGGVIDDLIVYRLADHEFLLVVNAAMQSVDFAWLSGRREDDEIGVDDVSATLAGLAVQGPRAAEVWNSLGGSRPALPPRNGIVRFGEGERAHYLCRTGYTGEDGFELFCPSVEAPAWWNRLLAAGAVPCGLGARDSLRLEMCYPLNGADLSPDRTPLEAGLSAFVDLEKPDFTGRGALLAQRAAGTYDRLTALQSSEPGPPLRAHYAVLKDGTKIGELCSGGLSTSLGVGIGLAYLPRESARVDTRLEVAIRDRRHPVVVVKKPFYRKSP
jgi:aminomethyltransferase